MVLDYVLPAKFGVEIVLGVIFQLFSGLSEMHVKRMKKRARYTSENARPFDLQWKATFEPLKTCLSELEDGLQEAELSNADAGMTFFTSSAMP